MPTKLMEYFNRQPRLGVISTSSRDGKVDCAVYGSPQMIDENTVTVAMAEGRTFANLKENPHASFHDHGDWIGYHGLEGNPGLSQDE